MATMTWSASIHSGTRIQNALGEMGGWSWELIKVVQKWFAFHEDKVETRGLCVVAQVTNTRPACRAKGLSWCPVVYHGEFSQGLKGCCIWETLRTDK